MSKKFQLKNVRLSFPSVFERATFEGTPTKYEATFLLDKKQHAETIEQIRTAIEQAIKTELKGAKVPADKRCLKDGDEVDYDGYQGCMSFKAANKKRPLVIDTDKTPLTDDDNKIYGGCYVNAIVQLWVQNNGYGKRINANLLGMQFVKHGEPFGEKSVADVSEFDAIDDDFDNIGDDEAPF